jgi:PEGA domain-containing protein
MDRRHSRVSPIFRNAALLAIVAAASRAGGQTDADKKQAQALQVAGVRLMQRGDNRGALDKFDAAFRLFPSPKILFNRGKAQSGLGHAADAVNDLERFLDEAPYAPKESRDEAERSIASLRPSVAYLELATDDVGSRIAVDGRKIGEAPLARPMAVAPGAHEVRFERTGMTAETRSVAPVAGQKLRVFVKLTPIASAVPAPVVAPPPAVAGLPAASGPAAPPIDVASSGPPDVEAPQPASRPWQLKAAWITGGAGVLFLAGGVTAQILSAAKNADFNAVTNAPSPNGQCNKVFVDSGGGRCPGLLDAANTRFTIAVVGYVASGLALAGSLVLYLIAPSPRASAHDTAIACLPSNDAAGIGCALWMRF